MMRQKMKDDPSISLFFFFPLSFSQLQVIHLVLTLTMSSCPSAWFDPSIFLQLPRDVKVSDEQ